MNGKNWKSKKKQWDDLVKPETKMKAAKAASLKNKGKSVKEIADELELSKSRIYELLRTKS
jgi:orotate phosphoribosyltransferase-like protein